jgi:hypothetical protein
MPPRQERIDLVFKSLTTTISGLWDKFIKLTYKTSTDVQTQHLKLKAPKYRAFFNTQSKKLDK